MPDSPPPAPTPLTDLSKQILPLSKSVADLRKGGPSARLLYLILAAYAAAVLCAAPLILFPDIPMPRFPPLDADYARSLLAAVSRYSTDLDDGLRFWSCIGILLLPFIGFVGGLTMQLRLAGAAHAAAAIDTNTSGLRREPALRHGLDRTRLREKYEQLASSGLGRAAATAIMADALRLAAMDRWERPSVIVAAHAPSLLRAIGLAGALQRVSLQLGILFTFVGLTMALATDAFRGTGDIMTLDLAPLTGALQVAFCSSIAGLMSSIALIAMAGYLRSHAQHVLMLLEAMAANILDLAKLTDSDPAVLTDLHRLRFQSQRTAEDVAAMRTTFAGAMSATNDAANALHHQLKAVNDQLKSVKQWQDAHQTFLTDIKKEDFPRAIREALAGSVTELEKKVAYATEATGRLATLEGSLTAGTTELQAKVAAATEAI